MQARIFFALVLLSALPAFAYGAGPGPGVCSTDPAERALDFWLGDWDISAPGGKPGSTSHVALALDKCMVVEDWNDGRGHAGENLFAYSADDKVWRGMFVDNHGRVHVFSDGKVTDSGAEFFGPSLGENGATVLNRVQLIRENAGAMRQVWAKSTDQGKTWNTVFQGDYTRKTP